MVEVVLDKNQRPTTVVVEVVAPTVTLVRVLILLLKVVVEHQVVPVVMLPLLEVDRLVANF